MFIFFIFWNFIFCFRPPPSCFCNPLLCWSCLEISQGLWIGGGVSHKWRKEKMKSKRMKQKKWNKTIKSHLSLFKRVLVFTTAVVLLPFFNANGRYNAKIFPSSETERLLSASLHCSRKRVFHQQAPICGGSRRHVDDVTR